MLQNFYTKTALIVIQSRRSTTSKGMNNWFNLAMADMMSLKDELFLWHSSVDYPLSINGPPSTLVIHIYLDTTHLSQADTYEIMGDYIHQHRSYKVLDRKCIILESWSLFCKKSTYPTSFDLPSFDKLSFIFFRALHSLARLLPGFSLYQRLRKNNSFSLCYRLGTSIHPYLNNDLPPDHPFVEGDCRKQSSVYEFSEIPTPIGILQLKVHYRIPFSKDDTFDYYGMDTNKNITTTSSNKNFNTHQFQLRQPQATIFRSQSSPILHQQGSSMVNSRIGQKAYNGSRSNLSRRAPALCISPFKSPSLSPIPTSSTSTITTNTNSTFNFTPIVEKSQSCSIHYGSSSKKGEFLSSFEKCKNKASLSRRNSIEKCPTKSNKEINYMMKQNNDLEKFMQFINTKPDLKLFQETRMSDLTNTTTTVTENNTHSDSTMWDPALSSSLLNASDDDLSQRLKISLDYFYTLRYAHSNLSESLASTSTTTRNRSSHRPSSSSFVTDSSGSLSFSSSSSLYQPHRALPTAVASSSIPIDTHANDTELLSRSSSSSSSQKKQHPIAPSKSSSQLSTMEPLMEEDDAATP
ncbi:unnamed protein product [Absidia cylindrospora]